MANRNGERRVSGKGKANMDNHAIGRGKANSFVKPQTMPSMNERMSNARVGRMVEKIATIRPKTQSMESKRPEAQAEVSAEKGAHHKRSGIKNIFEGRQRRALEQNKRARRQDSPEKKAETIDIATGDKCESALTKAEPIGRQ